MLRNITAQPIRRFNLRRQIAALETAIGRLDLAKFFLLIAWEMAVLTDAQYQHISEHLVEASKMLTGWKSYYSEKKTLP